MDDVAAEAQFSKATLYKYFRSKSELAFEILLHFLDEFDARLKVIVSRPSGFPERLKDWVSCSLEYLSENENLTRFLLLDRSVMRLLQIFVGRQEKTGTEVEKKFLRKIMAKRKAMREGSRALLREGVAAGEFRPIDIEAGVTFIEAVIEGYFVEKFWDNAKANLDRDTDFIEDFILFGIQNINVRKGDAS
jgi:AcrR family transcriptional regulator